MVREIVERFRKAAAAAEIARRRHFEDLRFYEVKLNS
jgi:hypothetical protein